MEYIVVRSTVSSILEDEVNHYLKRGYVLQGGVSITRHCDILCYAQAMVKQGE